MNTGYGRLVKDLIAFRQPLYRPKLKPSTGSFFADSTNVRCVSQLLPHLTANHSKFTNVGEHLYKQKRRTGLTERTVIAQY